MYYEEFEAAASQPDSGFHGLFLLSELPKSTTAILAME